MKFIADDGKIFDTIAECEEYEHMENEGKKIAELWQKYITTYNKNGGVTESTWAIDKTPPYSLKKLLNFSLQMRFRILELTVVMIMIGILFVNSSAMNMGLFFLKRRDFGGMIGSGVNGQILKKNIKNFKTTGRLWVSFEDTLLLYKC